MQIILFGFKITDQQCKIKRGVIVFNLVGEVAMICLKSYIMVILQMYYVIISQILIPRNF